LHFTPLSLLSFLGKSKTASSRVKSSQGHPAF
jgi:hypothetical protein